MDNKENEIVAEKDTFRAVIYTDGSMYHPNNNQIGYTGSSAHGYIYNIKEIGNINKDVPNGINTTIKGYATVVGNEYKVIPDTYIDAVYYRDVLVTNNVAETTAILFTIDKLLETEFNLDTIYVKSDSSYALHIYNELLNNFPTNIELKKNSDLWILIKEQIETLKNKNIKLELIKVAGHSGNFGNDRADILANQGRYLTELLIENNSDTIEDNYFILTPNKKYWKPNIERNPFLVCKSLYFIHDEREDTPNYTIMDYPTKKELGIGTNEALFGMLFIKDGYLDLYKDIEEILKVDRDINGKMMCLSELLLDSFYNRDFIFYKNIFKNNIYKMNKFRTGVSAMNLNLTLRTFQGLAKQAFIKTNTLKEVYKDYINNNIETDINVNSDKYLIDITDEIFETIVKETKNTTTSKKVCKLPTDIKVLNLNYELYGQKIKIALNFGTEIMTRNNLKKLEKTIGGVYLYLNKKNKVIEYSTIVDTEDTLAVYTNFYTRNIILK